MSKVTHSNWQTVYAFPALELLKDTHRPERASCFGFSVLHADPLTCRALLVCPVTLEWTAWSWPVARWGLCSPFGPRGTCLTHWLGYWLCVGVNRYFPTYPGPRGAAGICTGTQRSSYIFHSPGSTSHGRPVCAQINIRVDFSVCVAVSLQKLSEPSERDLSEGEVEED